MSLSVSGLEPVSDKSDSSLFISLCHDEFDTDPVVVKTMRLDSISPAVHIKYSHSWYFCERLIKSGDS
jgi:hypothetical protein